MEKEFNLSDTLTQEDRDEDLALYREEDVKEFIKRLRIYICNESIIDVDCTCKNCIMLNKLAGEKLI